MIKSIDWIALTIVGGLLAIVIADWWVDNEE